MKVTITLKQDAIDGEIYSLNVINISENISEDSSDWKYRKGEKFEVDHREIELLCKNDERSRSYFSQNDVCIISSSGIPGRVNAEKFFEIFDIGEWRGYPTARTLNII